MIRKTNNFNIRGKRGGVPISVVVLVFVVVALISYSLFIFMGEKREIKKSIGSSLFVEEIYSREAQIRFYVESSVYQSLKEMNLFNFNAEDFIRRFSDKLNAGKNYFPEVEQILDKVSDGVEYDKDRGILKVNFDIVLEKSLTEKIDGKEVETAKARHKFVVREDYRIMQEAQNAEEQA